MATQYLPDDKLFLLNELELKLANNFKLRIPKSTEGRYVDTNGDKIVVAIRVNIVEDLPEEIEIESPEGIWGIVLDE